MPMTRLIKKAGHWALVLGYVVLLLTLQPLLLEHVFAAGTSHEHSEQDVCTWLDHAASAGLYSVTPAPALVPVLVATTSLANLVFTSVPFASDSVRGPPSSSS